MRPLSFSLYTDFLLASGAARVSTVRAHKGRAEHDAYKPFKAAAVAVASRARPLAILDAMLDRMDDRLRRLHEPLIAGLRKFLVRQRGAVWQAPPQSYWFLTPQLEVEINPELGFLVEGRKVAVKLYCRTEPLERARVEIMCAMMHAALPADWTPAVLDVRQAKLVTIGQATKLQRAAIDARSQARAYADLYQVV